eukprot:TRINITY_DN12_c0_g1_i1.p2 TRINITY_DN12_c0_g1~~TRINITY_DN12_c0_g1_i1.p2  ORF type:complete len:289 (-),score=82.79 TRINITY_DN12_c0_g1_i1:56-922(-)
MGFVKVVKNKAYFKRFQVKYRRRREGKTDYRARRRLVTQDKNKYNSPKYRLVVRFTNRDVIAQIVYSRINGDFVMAAAYGHELAKYGVPAGQTNFASSYAVGLLLARRLLTKLHLAAKYEGVKEATGEMYVVEEIANGPRPFTALLDVGLVRTTTGHRVFAVMKGAVDGGLHIPHTNKRFAGYNKEDKSFDAAELRKRIFGVHVAEYMKSLEADEPEKFAAHFSKYIKAGIKGDKIEAMYKKAHAAIRKDPTFKPTEKKVPATQKKYHDKKLTAAERQARVDAKLAAQ